MQNQQIELQFDENELYLDMSMPERQRWKHIYENDTEREKKVSKREIYLYFVCYQNKEKNT